MYIISQSAKVETTDVCQKNIRKSLKAKKIENMDFSDQFILPEWIATAETQAVVFLGFFCVGAWVILQSLVQVCMGTNFLPKNYFCRTFLSDNVFGSVALLRSRCCDDHHAIVAEESSKGLCTKASEIYKDLEEQIYNGLEIQAVGKTLLYGVLFITGSDPPSSDSTVMVAKLSSFCSAVCSQRKATRSEVYESVFSTEKQ